MDPVRELPYWPAAMALLIEAGQMKASDYVPATKNRLHLKGRPQMPFSPRLFHSNLKGPSGKVQSTLPMLNCRAKKIDPATLSSMIGVR